MDSWQNLLSDMEASRCKYDKLHDRCRFAVVPGKSRPFLYGLVLILIVYSFHITSKLNHILERLDCTIPEESVSIIPEESSPRTSGTWRKQKPIEQYESSVVLHSDGTWWTWVTNDGIIWHFGERLANQPEEK